MAISDPYPITKAQTLFDLVERGVSFTSPSELRDIIKVGDVLRACQAEGDVDKLVRIGEFYSALYHFPDGRDITLNWTIAKLCYEIALKAIAHGAKGSVSETELKQKLNSADEEWRGSAHNAWVWSESTRDERFERRLVLDNKFGVETWY